VLGVSDAPASATTRGGERSGNASAAPLSLRQRAIQRRLEPGEAFEDLVE